LEGEFDVWGALKYKMEGLGGILISILMTLHCKLRMSGAGIAFGGIDLSVFGGKGREIYLNGWIYLLLAN